MSSFTEALPTIPYNLVDPQRSAAVIGANIRRARRKKGYSQTQLAILCGWKKFPSRISNYERGVREPKSGHLTILAQVLETTIDWLYQEHTITYGMGANEPLASYKAFHYVPLVKPHQFSAFLDKTLDAHQLPLVPAFNTKTKEAFGMILEGDSMESPSGVSFYQGMLLIFDPTIAPENHHFVLAMLDDMPSFKELIIDSGKRWLKPLNARYPLLEISSNTPIAGVLRAIVRPF